jgi:hypothetical protein
MEKLLNDNKTVKLDKFYGEGRRQKECNKIKMQNGYKQEKR